jgi:hypothetical protein
MNKNDISTVVKNMYDHPIITVFFIGAITDGIANIVKSFVKAKD